MYGQFGSAGAADLCQWTSIEKNVMVKTVVVDLAIVSSSGISDACLYAIHFAKVLGMPAPLAQLPCPLIPLQAFVPPQMVGTGNRSAHDRAWSSNRHNVWLHEWIRLLQNCLPDVQWDYVFFLRVTVLHKTPVKHLPQLFSWTTSKRWNHWSHHWDFTNQSLIVCALPHMFMHINIICTFIHNVYIIMFVVMYVS